MNSFAKQSKLILAVGLSAFLHVGLVVWMNQGDRQPSVQAVGIELIHLAAPQTVHHHVQNSKQPHLPHAPSSREKGPSQSMQDLVIATDAAPANSEASLIDQYMAQISQVVEHNKVYPREAVDRDEEGRVILEITVQADGSIQDSHIEEASPFRSLNQAALHTVQKIGRFPPLPKQVSSPVRLRIPLRFQLR